MLVLGLFDFIARRTQQHATTFDAYEDRQLSCWFDATITSSLHDQDGTVDTVYVNQMLVTTLLLPHVTRVLLVDSMGADNLLSLLDCRSFLTLYCRISFFQAKS
jgi:hypothetical protein